MAGNKISRDTIVRFPMGQKKARRMDASKKARVDLFYVRPAGQEQSTSSASGVHTSAFDVVAHPNGHRSHLLDRKVFEAAVRAAKTKET